MEQCIIYCSCRDVCLLERELAEKEAFDDKLRRELEVEKEKVDYINLLVKVL